MPVATQGRATVAKNFTVCFVIDSLGSMKDNDPTDLRLTAAKLFISLLDPGDAVGIVNFSTKSEIHAHLTTLNGPRWASMGSRRKLSL